MRLIILPLTNIILRILDKHDIHERHDVVYSYAPYLCGRHRKVKAKHVSPFISVLFARNYNICMYVSG